jgi:hypothetical protein
VFSLDLQVLRRHSPHVRGEGFVEWSLRRRHKPHALPVSQSQSLSSYQILEHSHHSQQHIFCLKMTSEKKVAENMLWGGRFTGKLCQLLALLL